MDEANSHKIDTINLTKQKKIRLDKIAEIENYFHQEVNKKNYAVKN